MTGVGIGIYEGEGVAGDEISSTYEGRHLTFPESSLASPNALVQKGDPVVVHTAGGDIVGVALNTASANTDLIAIDTEGIWMMAVEAEDDFGNSAIAVGDALYINDTQGTCTISKKCDPEQNTLFGYALGSLTQGGTGQICVKVHWGPSEDRILMGLDDNGGSRYTEATTARPRVKINSDYTGVDGIHWNMLIHAALNPATTTAASLYAIRGIADLNSDKEMTDGNMHGLHGYARIMGTLNGSGLGGVRVAGVKGEIYSTGATLTGCDFIGGVMAMAMLGDELVTGMYGAFVAYSAGGSGDCIPHAVLYAYGTYRNALDFTGWVGVPAGNHTIVLDGNRGYTPNTNDLSTDTLIAVIRVEINDVTGFVPVMANAP